MVLNIQKSGSERIEKVSRLIQEAMLIDSRASMNSKSEWRQNSRQRLILDRPDWVEREVRKKN